MKAGPKFYFKLFYNYIDMFQYLGTIFVVCLNLAEYEHLGMIEKRNIVILIIACQGIKFVVDWLRLFDRTSFYFRKSGRIKTGTFLDFTGALD